MKRILMAALAVAALLALGTGPAWAEGAWLDGPLVQWNAPGMAVPAAPPRDLTFADPRCGRDERPVETLEDTGVTAAGWSLFSTYQAGWGVKLIWGVIGYDGMCRPSGYQIFVFADGVFAGTLSPDPMVSRSDGAGGSPFLQAPGDVLTAVFQRYADTDPLCCPSRRSFVSYRIERTEQGPVVVADSVSTMPNEP